MNFAPPPSKLNLCALLSLLLALARCSGSDPPASWAGQTYLLGVTKDRWSEPARIGNEIGDFVPNFLFRVEAANGRDISVTLGTADQTPAQQGCNPTAVISASQAAYPSSVLQADAFPLYIQHPTKDVRVNATIRKLVFTNVLPNGSTPASEGELSAVMDMRDLYPLFTQIPEPNPDVVCAALESFGAPCEICGHDGATYCLTIHAVRLGARMSELAVEPIDASALDPSCAVP